MSFQGRRNIYTCQKCGHHVVSWDRDKGVTPFMIRCDAVGPAASRGTGEAVCGGFMQSSLYRVFDQRMRPQIEWYRPDAVERDALAPDLREHVDNGGLLKRRFIGANPPPHHDRAEGREVRS